MFFPFFPNFPFPSYWICSLFNAILFMIIIFKASLLILKIKPGNYLSNKRELLHLMFGFIMN